MRKTVSKKAELTNQDKVLFPKTGITKGDIVAYYRKIASVMLVYMKNRAVTLLRYPDGITHEGFYQKDASDYFPVWIKRVCVKKRELGGEEAHKAGAYNNYVVCNDARTLVYLANLACLTPHLWLSKIDKLDYPDRMIFDLDPGSKTDFRTVCATALKLKKLLEAIGLAPFVMTTGSRGLHVTVPIKRTKDFDYVRALARDIADSLAQDDPDSLTTEIRLNKRKGRLFIDSGRNSFAATAVAPYAVRPHPGAPVAAPVTWAELKNKKLTSQSFTIKNIFNRIKRVGDVWTGMQRSARSMSGARKKFDKLFQ